MLQFWKRGEYLLPANDVWAPSCLQTGPSPQQKLYDKVLTDTEERSGSPQGNTLTFTLDD